MIDTFEICEEGKRRFLLLKDSWSEEALSVLRDQNIKGLRISAYAGWTEGDVDFLACLPFLESLDLWVPRLKDTSPIYSLVNLRRLSLNGPTTKIDFTRFPLLQDLQLGRWRPGKYDSVFDCSLKSLGITSYSEPDLKAIARIVTLQNLAVSFSRVDDLSGVSKLPKLIRLSLAGLSNLKSLDGIEGSPSLLLLWIEQLKNLAKIDALSHLRTLRTLNLSDCPKIESLRPVTDLPELEAVWFFGKTNIRDGDLVPVAMLSKLKYAKFVDRPHYSHRSSEFPKSTDIFR